MDSDPAPSIVLDTMHSAFLARALFVVADLGIADLLASGPLSCIDIAAMRGVAAMPLHQVLRSVTSIGLLRTEPGPESGPRQRFSLTVMGETLREGHPAGTRELILTMQGPAFWNSLGVLPERVATGRTGPEIAYDVPFFSYLNHNPQAAKLFNRMMIATHRDEPLAVAKAYDFSWARSVIDVGGGIGSLLLTVAEEYPQLCGTVFDLPGVADEAREHIAARDMAHRCDVADGSFLESVPCGADVYLLSRILHDWDDATCVQILRTCAQAMTPASRVLLVEKVVPDGDDPHPSKMLDLVMLTMTNGRERTVGEYRELLTGAGLEMLRLVPTASASSVIEVGLADQDPAGHAANRPL